MSYGGRLRPLLYSVGEPVIDQIGFPLFSGDSNEGITTYLSISGFESSFKDFITLFVTL